MQDLLIVGAGGCGREILKIVKEIHAIQGPRWNIRGFLDDTEAPLRGKACDYGVVGTIRDYVPRENEVLVMGNSAPEDKRMLVGMLKDRGAVFTSVIHPYAALGDFCTVGEGAVIYAGFGMTVNVRIGAFATLLACVIGHDVTVGDFCTISSWSNVMGYVTIGDGVFIGGNAAIAPRATVEDGAFVGVGSVVLRRVRAGKRVFGNPAREMDFV